MRSLRLAGLFLAAALAAIPSVALALSRNDVARPAVAPNTLPHSPARPFAVPGEVMVALPAGESFALAPGRATVPGAARVALLARLGLAPERVLGGASGGLRSRPGGSALAGRFAVLRSLDPHFDPAAAAAELRASGQFVAACPNVEIHLLATLPNDARLDEQWWVRDPGGSDVRLPEAWDVTHGSASVVIAILDTGVDTGHPDLATKIWTNPGEIAGNGIDDDGNGYIDDVHGWDFGDGDNDPDPVPLIDDIGLDEGFHGTFCAGIAGAATNNVEGMAGAGWNSRLMPIKIFDSSFGSTAAMLTDAVGYAIDNGAKVLSMSIGAADAPGIPEFFQALMDAANAAGLICVAAAGNDGVDVPVQYPAACAHVISVAATTSDNLRADFSNYGPTVDVAAPGSFMFSALCRNYVIDDLSQIFYLYFFYWDGETPYMYGDGTSFACPLVSGISALVLAGHPGITSDGMRDLLVATGDPVDYDAPIGPRVNAFRAVSATTAVGGSVLGAKLSIGAPTPNPSAGLTRLSISLPRGGEAELAVFDAAGRRVRTLRQGFLPAGEQEARWDGTDAAGHPAAAGLYFARLEAGGELRVARIVRLQR